MRRTLYGNAVKHLGTRIAKEITRKDVIDSVNSIVAQGANVQAGNVLRELSLAYEFAIGLGHFTDDFANPVLLAKSSLIQTPIKLTNGCGACILRTINNKLAKSSWCYLSDPDLYWYLKYTGGLRCTFDFFSIPNDIMPFVRDLKSNCGNQVVDEKCRECDVGFLPVFNGNYLA